MKSSHVLALSSALLAGSFVTTSFAADVASLGDAFAQGKISFDSRLRWEDADQSNLKSSDAYTVGTRFGFTTAAFNGFQARIEGENVASIGDTNDYNAAGTNPGGAGHTVIGDVPGTDINQAWISYTEDQWLTFKAGRQQLNLQNTRFVGDGAWRQNMQTFDTASIAYSPDKTIDLYYGYVWHVSRAFFNKAPQPDFTSDSHFLNASYSGLPFGKLSGYAYLLDFENSPANSSDTYGASFAGSAPVSPDFKVTYRAEYADQKDAGTNPVNYEASYYDLELGGAVKPFDFNVGYEVLGSDHGKKGFATPLANLHPFNGWADIFTTTPANGLRDFSVTAGIALPGGFPVKVAYHSYRSDFRNLDYGSEWDAMVTHKIAKYWTLFAQIAHYNGAGPFFDTDKIYLSVSLDY
ncbi:MAG TPA: hypothetical protein VG710_14540 [Opitutus sp.]|nr:hypothetical protein [Opitutus sp.]